MPDASHWNGSTIKPQPNDDFILSHYSFCFDPLNVCVKLFRRRQNNNNQFQPLYVVESTRNRVG